MTIDLRQLIVLAVVIQTAFLVVFSDHFFLESGMIGGTEALYSLLRDRLAPYNLGPEFYSFQFMNWAYSDAADYLVAIAGDETREPFRFRVVYIWLVSGLNALITGCETVRSECGLRSVAFVAKLVNWGGLLLTFWVLLGLAPRGCRHAPVPLAIAVAGTLCFGAFLTAPFVMADILCGLVFALAARFFVTRQFAALVITVSLGVLVKEIAIVLGILIAAEFLRDNRRPLVAILAGGALPLITFVAIRIALGGDPLSVNYGWNVSEGYFEIRYVFLHAEGYFIPYLTKTLCGIGVIAVFFALTLRYVGRKQPELWAFALVVAALMMANFFLASGVVRVVSPLAPLLAAALLHYGVYLSSTGSNLVRPKAN